MLCNTALLCYQKSDNMKAHPFFQFSACHFRNSLSFKSDISCSTENFSSTKLPTELQEIVSVIDDSILETEPEWSFYDSDDSSDGETASKSMDMNDGPHLDDDEQCPSICSHADVFECWMESRLAALVLCMLYEASCF